MIFFKIRKRSNRRWSERSNHRVYTCTSVHRSGDERKENVTPTSMACNKSAVPGINVWWAGRWVECRQVRSKINVRWLVWTDADGWRASCLSYCCVLSYDASLYVVYKISMISFTFFFFLSYWDSIRAWVNSRVRCECLLSSSSHVGDTLLSCDASAIHCWIISHSVFNQEMTLCFQSPYRMYQSIKHGNLDYSQVQWAL